MNALRAFEAAARTGSYVAAGEEIGMSAAAVSQHVRKLEDHLGKQLFTRHTNRITLTDAGRTLFEGAHAGLQIISDTADSSAHEARGARLVISGIESVTEKWLAPRLCAYAQAHEDFRFDLRIEPDPVDLSRHDIDLRIGYDPSPYVGQTIVPLGHDVVLPLASPAYLARHPAARTEGMAAVPPRDLLHVDWGPRFGSRPTWDNWFAAAGLPMPGGGRGARIGNSAVALDLARQGLGVVLGQRMVAHDDLEAGAMVAMSPISLPLKHGYCLVYPPATPLKRHLSGLVEHLVRQWAAARPASA